MTKVFYRKYYDKDLIIIEGHSGYAESGKDIVCAGISTLAFSVINCLLTEECEGRIKLLRNIVRDGYICLEIENKDEENEKLQGILSVFLTGVEMLSESYPQYIKSE